MSKSSITICFVGVTFTILFFLSSCSEPNESTDFFLLTTSSSSNFVSILSSISSNIIPPSYISFSSSSSVSIFFFLFGLSPSSFCSSYWILLNLSALYSWLNSSYCCCSFAKENWFRRYIPRSIASSIWEFFNLTTSFPWGFSDWYSLWF